jgi:DHA2 family multidrug resistance protein-like MFS transporter
MFFSPTVRQIVASAPVARTAAAGAVTTTTRGAGQTLGATAVATIFAAGLGTGAASALIAAVLAGGAGMCSLLLLRLPVSHVEFEDLPEI